MKNDSKVPIFDFNNPSPDEETAMEIVLEAANHSARQLIDAKEQAERAEHRADHDPLTGLLVKAAWKKQLEERIDQAKPGSLGILFIDLKDFKRANDDQGHEYGDEILRLTAGILQSNLRSEGEHADTVSFESSDDRKVAGRLGGDEFAIYVDLTAHENTTFSPEERLSTVSERLKTAFYENAEIQDSGVGISVGEAIWEGQTGDELIALADKKMYEDKAKQKEQDGSYR